jgi:hypothetical protein
MSNPDFAACLADDFNIDCLTFDTTRAGAIDFVAAGNGLVTDRTKTLIHNEHPLQAFDKSIRGRARKGSGFHAGSKSALAHRDYYSIDFIPVEGQARGNW